MSLQYLKGVFGAAMGRKMTDGALSERYRLALVALQDQERIQEEILALDASTLDGQARRECLQSEMTEALQRTGLYMKESAKILARVADADDPALTVGSLSVECLHALLEGNAPCR